VPYRVAAIATIPNPLPFYPPRCGLKRSDDAAAAERHLMVRTAAISPTISWASSR
jgi:hypothetical protein